MTKTLIKKEILKQHKVKFSTFSFNNRKNVIFKNIILTSKTDNFSSEKTQISIYGKLSKNVMFWFARTTST